MPQAIVSECGYLLQGSSWMLSDDLNISQWQLNAIGYPVAANSMDSSGHDSQKWLDMAPSPQVACYAIRFILSYVPPLILLIGTIGNVLSFSVLCQRSMLHTSPHLYLAILALVDEGVLCVGLLRRWTDYLTGIRLEDRHWVLCKALNFAGVTTSCLSVWIIVAVTMERVLVVISPFQSSHLQRTKRSRNIILTLSLFICTLSFHFFFTLDIVSINPPEYTQMSNATILGVYTYNVTATNAHYTVTSNMISQYPLETCDFRNCFIQNGFKRAWIWIDAALYSHIPFLLITISNVSIVISLRGASKKRACMMNTWNSQNLAHISKHNRSPFARRWRSLNYFKVDRSEQTREQTCAFCAQSFPMDRYHFASLRHNYHFQNSAYSTQSPAIPVKKRRSRSNQSSRSTAVNIRFFSYKVDVIEVKSVAQRPRRHMATEMRQLTVLLLLISSTFFLTTVPVVVVKVLIACFVFSREHQPKLELIDCIAEMLMYTNHAINFYLYYAVGTRFRRELRRVLRCDKTWRKKMNNQMRY